MSRTRKDTLKSYRRARGGRTLPRSGGGVHSGPTRKHLQEEAEMRDWKNDLDNWIQWEPDDAIECDQCGDDGDRPDPYCPACDGTGWMSATWAKDRDYDRAEAERADEWRNE